MHDAIVCLGCSLRTRRGRENSRLRALKAAKLYREGKAKHVLFSGWQRRGTLASEAQFMASIALHDGVLYKAITLEELSRNTVENAYFASIICERKRWKKLLLVTDPYHLVRATVVFRKVMPHASIVGEASELPPGTHILLACKEWVKAAWLWLRGVHIRRSTKRRGENLRS